MGTMATYRCSECGYNKGLHLGVGMMFPRVSDGVKESIASGEYGPEFKKAYESCELPAVNPEDLVYECPSCGYWDVREDASLYEPVDIESMKKEEFGIKTVEEWGGIPYMSWYDIESGKYRLVLRYSPPCPECGNKMHSVDVEPGKGARAVSLKCPKCESLDGRVSFSGWWD